MQFRVMPLIVLSGLAAAASSQLVLPYSGTDPTATVSSFQIIKSGTAGRANTLYITNASNSSDVLLINTVGLGRAIYAWINNSGNSQPAIRADSNGSGIGVFGLMTGTGRAGTFRIMNPANNNYALFAQTNGGGPALRVEGGAGRSADFVGNARITGNNLFAFALDIDSQTSGLSATARTQANGAYIYNYGQSGINTATGLHVGTGVTEGTAIFAETFGSAIWGVGYGVAGKGTVGQASGASSFALYAFGATGATGTKSFQIDHPLNPERAILQHYCSEGPEPMNVYSGITTTDARGFATVRLPEYFESINVRPRYQLTVIDDGDEFVMAKVVRGVHNNAFVLRTSQPRTQVSWEVKAVRNDLWVRKYGAPTEIEKPLEDRGKYLEPALYGQPEEARMGGRVAQARANVARVNATTGGNAKNRPAER